MEQFRQLGEVLGSLRALMVLEEDIQINRRQCCLLLDLLCLAFNTIAEEIKLNLKLEEKNTKWKALEHPLRELHRVFKEGELYVKQCMDKKNWWAKAIIFHQNNDCVEFHIHNLLSYFPAVIEAVETAGEISGLDQDEMQRRRVALARKYDKDWNDPKLFQWRFGKQYLIPREICIRFDSAWREDRWKLLEALTEKKSSGNSTKNEQRLAEMFLKKINGTDRSNGKLFPSSILFGGDYQVRRRLGGQYKEIQWLGDCFALRHFFGEVEPLSPEIATLLSISHPNILQYLCGFYDEEKKEALLVMELMSKDLSCYMKENCGSRRRVLFSLPVVVDIMFQIARGMEFLHSQKIYHGELNPSNIFLKARNHTEGYFHVKISGFGLSSIKSHSSPNSSPIPSQNQNQNQNESNQFVWYAPEVLIEQEQPGSASTSKYSEKADVYSFGMLCFELLTGKVPFEDGHLQGGKMSRNIRAGERPLFPYASPKYLVNLTKKCWHTDPIQRPSFSSICRILRYIKKFLVMNSDHEQPEMQLPPLEYMDIESWFLKKFAGDLSFCQPSVTQIPFQMFAYRLAERDRSVMSNKDKNGELASEAASTCRDDSLSILEDPFTAASDTKSAASDIRSVCSDFKSICSDMRSLCSEIPEKKSICTRIPEKKVLVVKKTPDVKARKNTSGHSAGSVTSRESKTRSTRSSATKTQCGRSASLNRASRLTMVMGSVNSGRQRASSGSGHSSE
ncbi:hypothetical protein SLEP1_g40430 [Rubroshorea leprosula]|uniref:Protein kinase domain-containing protein n=1 Tax=Rubroshorea leprosula TaxID=152421 RepID=A0AAV5L489_9ROSI|nr:hypothetical protein SLEP1_g40430 [Rubroshorea leprosula]